MGRPSKVLLCSQRDSTQGGMKQDSRIAKWFYQSLLVKQEERTGESGLSALGKLSLKSGQDSWVCWNNKWLRW